MDKLPFDVPRFQQRQVLQLAPACSAKDLQNWLTRGIIPGAEKNVGKQGRRLWSPAGVIFLKAMSCLTKLSIPPSDAAAIADTISGHAEVIYAQYPVRKEKDGSLSWITSSKHIDLYHRAYVYKFDGVHQVHIQSGDLGSLRTEMPDVYITIEVDQLIFAALNLMHKGSPETAPNQASSDPMGVLDEAAASIAELRSRIEGPGGK